MSSIESNTKLLKLHLQWPDRKKMAGTPDEAIEFFKWLFLNYYDLPFVSDLESVEDVDVFLENNKKVLQSKPSGKSRQASNSRIEPRIQNDVAVVMSVAECENDELVGIKSSGLTIDLGLHGMKISLAQEIPPTSKVTLNIETGDGDIFELLGETKWTHAVDDGQVLGLRILESAGFENWRDQFGRTFVAPRIGRNYTPERKEA